MGTYQKLRMIVWLVSNDRRYIGNALKILNRQHNGVEILGVTAIKKLS